MKGLRAGPWDRDSASEDRYVFVLLRFRREQEQLSTIKPQ